MITPELRAQRNAAWALLRSIPPLVGHCLPRPALDLLLEVSIAERPLSAEQQAEYEDTYEAISLEVARRAGAV